MAVWHQLQTELAALSTNSSHLTLEGATHMTLVTNRQFVASIVETVQKMVAQIRAKNR